MSQNLLSLTLTDDQLSAINNALTALEAATTGLIAMDNATTPPAHQDGRQVRGLRAPDPAGAGAEPGHRAGRPGLAEAQTDLRALDQIRPVLARLQRLSERASDSEMALGSDLMSVALEGYGLLKVSGRNRGLEGASEALSARFARRRSAPAAPPAA